MRNTTKLPSITHFKTKAKYYHLTKPELKTHTQALQYLAKELGHESYQAIKPHLPLENSVITDPFMIASYKFKIAEIEKRFSHSFTRALNMITEPTLPFKGKIFISGRVGAGKTLLANEMVYYDKDLKKVAYIGRKEYHSFFETTSEKRFQRIEYIDLTQPLPLITHNILHFYINEEGSQEHIDGAFFKSLIKKLLENGYSIILDELMLNIECNKAILKMINQYHSDSVNFMLLSQETSLEYINKFHSLFDTLLYFKMREKPLIEELEKAYSLNMAEGVYAVFERVAFKEESVSENAPFTFEDMVRSSKRRSLRDFVGLVAELNTVFIGEDKPLMDMLNLLTDDVYSSFAATVIKRNNEWHNLCEQNNLYDEEHTLYFKLRAEHFSKLLFDFSLIDTEHSSLHEKFLSRLLFYIDEDRENTIPALNICDRLDMLEFMQLSYVYNGGDISKIENLLPNVKGLYDEFKKVEKH